MKVLLTSQSVAMGGAEVRMLQEIEVFRGLGWDVCVATPKELLQNPDISAQVRNVEDK